MTGEYEKRAGTLAWLEQEQELVMGTSTYTLVRDWLDHHEARQWQMPPFDATILASFLRHQAHEYVWKDIARYADGQDDLPGYDLLHAVATYLVVPNRMQPADPFTHADPLAHLIWEAEAYVLGRLRYELTHRLGIEGLLSEAHAAERIIQESR